MAIPKNIEIIPPQHPARAAITVPGSKSITNRALILAALGQGETVLKGALWSQDTQVMVDCLQELGFMVNLGSESDEPCNRTITVYGRGGELPRGGTLEAPLELFVGNAGTAARFLSALVCLGRGVYRVHGVERMHDRPQRALLQALRQLGYRIDAPSDRLPALIHGGGPRPGKCRLSIEESSQFASALLLCAEAGGWEVEVLGENPDESPYVRMTSEMVRSFGLAKGNFQIEADASSGSYFIAAGLLLPAIGMPSGPGITVLRWPTSGWQADEAFPEVASRMNGEWAGRGTGAGLIGGEQGRVNGAGGVQPSREGTSALSISRRHDLADSIMTAIVLAPFAARPVKFLDLGRLRVQECERVIALRTELARCGATVVEEGDTLTVFPSSLRSASIDTYQDHRMAMCFAVAGLKVPGIKIRDPACVRKTFPDFFQKLAALPPKGIGAIIRDGATGREISPEDLFAD